MTFEQWIKRPVYVVHCHTFKIALRLLGIPVPAADRGLATRGPSRIDLFRAYPQFRDANAQGLRNLVADEVRRERVRKVAA